jgi:cytochrome c oxidase assembly factor 5
MEPERKESLIDQLFTKIDDKLGPSKVKYQPACHDVREMLIECVMESDCMKLPNSSFGYSVNYILSHCVRGNIDKECKAIRYDYMLCRKSQVYWTKHFSKDDPR